MMEEIVRTICIAWGIFTLIAFPVFVVCASVSSHFEYKEFERELERRNNWKGKNPPPDIYWG